MSDTYFENEFENEFEDCCCGHDHCDCDCDGSCCCHSGLSGILENKYVRIGLLAIGVLAVVGLIVYLTGRRNRYIL